MFELTFNDLFKVTIIRRQITWKWYNIAYSYTYNNRPIKSRIAIICRTAPFQWPWTTRTPSFKVTPFFDAEYHRNGTAYRQFQWNTNRDLHTRPTQQCHFEWPWVNLSDWLSKIFNDTKRRAVSRRQLSFLLKYWWMTLLCGQSSNLHVGKST